MFWSNYLSLGMRLPICLGRLLTFCGCSFDMGLSPWKISRSGPGIKSDSLGLDWTFSNGQSSIYFRFHTPKQPSTILIDALIILFSETDAVFTDF